MTDTAPSYTVRVHRMQDDEPERPAPRHKGNNGKGGENSLTKRVERFYKENPSEWLTWEDACAKFGCTKDQLRWTVQALRNEQRLHIDVVSVLKVRA